MSFLYYYLPYFSKIRQYDELFFIDTVVWLFPVKICKAASVTEMMVVGLTLSTSGPQPRRCKPFDDH